MDEEWYHVEIENAQTDDDEENVSFAERQAEWDHCYEMGDFDEY